MKEFSLEGSLADMELSVEKARCLDGLLNFMSLTFRLLYTRQRLFHLL